MRIVGVKLIFVLLLLLVACGNSPAQEQARDPLWATCVDGCGVDNLFKIDEGVYRSGQPDAAGFKELYAMGVREVLNLRNHHNDNDEAAGTPLTLHHVRMRAGRSETDQFVEALQIIKDRKGPIVIHCWHGSDRTGIVTALYRMVFQSWPRAKAIDELVNGGYGYHSTFTNIITYLNEVDVQVIKSELQ